MENEKVQNAKDYIIGLNLSFQESVTLAMTLLQKDGKDTYHNYGFREELIAELLGLHRIIGPYGKDTAEYELKSTTLKRNRKGYHITKKKVLGEIGRSDKDSVSDSQDIVFSLFDKEKEEPILSFIVKNNDNFKLFRNKNKVDKQKQMENNKNKRDTTPVKFGDLVSFEYEIRYWKDESVVHIDEL